MQDFQLINDEMKALGARVAGASADTWASLGAFKEQLGLEFEMLSDWPKYETIAAFGVERENSTTALRGTFVFDQQGVLRAVIDDQQNMEAHPDGALAAVKAIVGA